MVWALWHVPFEFSGILHINGISPVQLALIMPPGTLAAGLILGWLWVRTESVWLVAVAHGALNDWGQYAFKYMDESAPPRIEIAVLSGGSLVLLLVGLLLLYLGVAEREMTR
jgi:membrane protease YdiL (CAAX protease family)